MNKGKLKNYWSFSGLTPIHLSNHMMEVMVIMTIMIFFLQHRQRHDLMILFCSTRMVDSWLFKDQNSWFYLNRHMIFFMQHRQRHNLLILFCLTRIVDSWLFKDQNGWFYSNTESTFWVADDILEMPNPILLIRNNKINKMGLPNQQNGSTFQQSGLQKQQKGAEKQQSGILRNNKVGNRSCIG